MPIYDFACACGEVTEARAGYETSALPCACGRLAKRVAVYQSQYTITETGGKGIPRLNNAKSEKGKYRVSDFVEASSEIAHEAEKGEAGRQARENPQLLQGWAETGRKDGSHKERRKWLNLE